MLYESLVSCALWIFLGRPHFWLVGEFVGVDDWFCFGGTCNGNESPVSVQYGLWKQKKVMVVLENDQVEVMAESIDILKRFFGHV